MRVVRARARAWATPGRSRGSSTTTTEPPPEPTSDGRARRAPARHRRAAAARAKRQYRELRRELRLLAFAHQDDYPFAARPRRRCSPASSDSSPRRWAGRGRSGAGRGAATSTSRPGGPRAAPILGTMLEMFDLADAFCRAERLLSMAANARAARASDVGTSTSTSARSTARPIVVWPAAELGLGITRSTGLVTRGPLRAGDARAGRRRRGRRGPCCAGLGGARCRTGRGSRGRPSPSTSPVAFVLGLLPGCRRTPRRAAWALLLGPGLLGGFTTVSTYAEQARALAAGAKLAMAGAYVARHARRRAAAAASWPARCARAAPRARRARWRHDGAAGGAGCRRGRAPAVRVRARPRRPRPPRDAAGQRRRVGRSSGCSRHWRSREAAWALLGTGFCGGLTTFSAFTVQTVERGAGWEPPMWTPRPCSGSRPAPSAGGRLRLRRSGVAEVVQPVVVDARSGGRPRARR